MDVQGELLNTIQLLVNKAVANLQNNDVVGVVTSVSGNTYTVKINGVEYSMKDGVGCKPTVGSVVWCRVPNGHWGSIYIEAIK